MSLAAGISAKEALELLKKGNEKFVSENFGIGDISPKRRLALTEGQNPYAVIITCSDSRVVPEAAFSAGLGDIFVIRSAGNISGDHELGSIEYATDHLGAKLIVVMGHESCGAVGAVLEGMEIHGFAKTITDCIKDAIGDEKDPVLASRKNAEHAKNEIIKAMNLTKDSDIKVVSAFYNISTGKVDFDI